MRMHTSTRKGARHEHTQTPTRTAHAHAHMHTLTHTRQTKSGISAATNTSSVEVQYTINEHNCLRLQRPSTLRSRPAALLAAYSEPVGALEGTIRLQNIVYFCVPSGRLPAHPFSGNHLRQACARSPLQLHAWRATFAAAGAQPGARGRVGQCACGRTHWSPWRRRHTPCPSTPSGRANWLPAALRSCSWMCRRAHCSALTSRCAHLRFAGIRGHVPCVRRIAMHPAAVCTRVEHDVAIGHQPTRASPTAHAEHTRSDLYTCVRTLRLENPIGVCGGAQVSGCEDDTSRRALSLIPSSRARRPHDSSSQHVPGPSTWQRGGAALGPGRGGASAARR